MRRLVEQKRFDPAGGGECNRAADDDASDGVADALTDDEPNDVAQLSAQRDTHAHLVRALHDVVGDDAVQPNGGKRQRQESKDQEHRRAELP